MRKLTFLFSPLLLITLLFPALAYGVDVKFEDLVGREGLYYKKFTEVPFTGKVTGSIQGSFKDGKWDGPWVGYYPSGPLLAKGTMKTVFRTVLGSDTIPMDSHTIEELSRMVRETVLGSVTTKTELWMRNTQEPLRTV
jgi:hypothetical protein